MGDRVCKGQYRRISGARIDHQHSIGVVDWRNAINGYENPPPSGTPPSTYDYYGVADQFSDLNVDTVVGVTSLANNAAQVAAISRSIALASATLEGSVLETMEDLPDTASTASRFGWGNNPGADNTTADPEDPCFTGDNPRAFFDYTGTSTTTRAGLYLFEGSASGCNAAPLPFGSSVYDYTSAAEGVIKPYLDAGFKVSGSAETYLGPGARFGPCYGSPGTTQCALSQQRGDAFVATQYDSSGNVLQVAHVLSSLNGLSKGGGGKQPERFASYDPANMPGDVLKDRFVDRSVLLGVDLKTGTAGYSTPSLISIGNGGAPYKLDYSLSFKAGPTSCKVVFGPCVALDLEGAGPTTGTCASPPPAPARKRWARPARLRRPGLWRRSWPCRTSSPRPALPILNQDVSSPPWSPDWWRQQMLANTVTISKGFSGQQYVRLVNGSWMPPVGAPGTLVESKTGSRVKIRPVLLNGFGSGWNESTARYWDNTAVSFALTNASGDVMSFASYKWQYDLPNDNKCAQVFGYTPTTWTWPQGVSLTRFTLCGLEAARRSTTPRASPRSCPALAGP